VVRLGLAVNERRRGQEAVNAERTHFLEVQAWRELAEWASELRKGDGLVVLGRLVNDSRGSSSGERRGGWRVAAGGVERPPRGPAQAGGSRPPRDQTGGVDIDEGLEDFPPEEDLPF
jgi:single-strand DNA-binding protein